MPYNRYGDGFFTCSRGGTVNDMGPNDIYQPIGYTSPVIRTTFRATRDLPLEIPSAVNFPEAWRDGLFDRSASARGNYVPLHTQETA